MAATIIIFLSFILIQYSLPQQLITKDGACYKIKCMSNDQMPVKCTQKSDYNMEIRLNPDICKSNQNCIINKKYSGYCKPKVYFEFIKSLFPGQQCDQRWHYYSCGFGSKQCSGGVCQGVATDKECSASADCIPTNYCSEGICTPQKELGAECSNKYQCGREAFCHYQVDSNTGVCTLHFSVPSSDTSTYVLPKINDKIFADIVDSDANLLCQSGYVDPTTGLCSQGAKSLSMGQACKSNSDCESSVSGNTAECKCSWGSDGSKVCSALPGDTPFVQARQAFKDYYNATKGCHLAAKWQQCGESKMYHDWKCKELKAKYYAETLHMNELKICMDKLSKDLPIFKEIEFHCSRS